LTVPSATTAALVEIDAPEATVITPAEPTLNAVDAKDPALTTSVPPFTVVAPV
jgi:hypothetical protein